MKEKSRQLQYKCLNTNLSRIIYKSNTWKSVSKMCVSFSDGCLNPFCRWEFCYQKEKKRRRFPVIDSIKSVENNEGGSTSRFSNL